MHRELGLASHQRENVHLQTQLGTCWHSQTPPLQGGSCVLLCGYHWGLSCMLGAQGLDRVDVLLPLLG